MLKQFGQSAISVILRETRISSHCLSRNFSIALIKDCSLRHGAYKQQNVSWFVQPSYRMSSKTEDANIPIVNYEDVKEIIKHHEKILIDVREPQEIKETGSIPTCINIPLGSINQELSSGTSEEYFKEKYERQKPNETTDLTFYCKSGVRSLKAAVLAQSLGFKNVKSYKGSWVDWAEHEGLPK